MAYTSQDIKNMATTYQQAMSLFANSSANFAKNMVASAKQFNSNMANSSKAANNNKNISEAQQKYKDIQNSLRTPDQQQFDYYKNNLDILSQANLSADDRKDLLKRMNDKTVRSVPDVRYSGKNYGIISDFVDIAEDDKKLNDWKESQLAVQKELHDQKILNEQEYNDNISAIKEAAEKKQYELQMAYAASSLGVFSTLTGSIADMYKQTAGESSTAYKTMFLVSKAAAIAEAIINTEVAATKSLGAGGLFGISAATIIRSIGYASIGLIASQTIAGMAHSGIDSIPQEGTWLLDRGERVVDARTNADLKDFLQTTSKSSNSFTVNVPVNVGDNLSIEDGKQLGNMLKQIIISTIQEQKRPGGLLNRH